MKSNLLLNKIVFIQNEYHQLLVKLLPKLQSSHFTAALDELNLFWLRYIDVVQLYLKYMFSGKESYVFTASTYMDFEDNEHLPFLLVGKKHLLDDPLSSYAELCQKMPEGRDSELLYEQIKITAEDNLKILENTKNGIFILPLRILNQSKADKSFFQLGEQIFTSLFNEIESLDDYFKKCNSIEDVINFACKNIGNLILFSEYDNPSLPFEKRFEIFLSESEYMIDKSQTDSYNFFIQVFGCIQQAIDIIISCWNYDCIPYIRYPVSLHYIILILENMTDNKYVKMLQYKMIIAFIVHQSFDKERFVNVSTDVFLKKNQEYDFNEKLFCTLEHCNLNDDNYSMEEIKKLVLNELDKFYAQFD